MPGNRDSNLELLLKKPWLVSAALGFFALAALRWGLPVWAGYVNAGNQFWGCSTYPVCKGTRT
jgi:hypothetical protein